MTISGTFANRISASRIGCMDTFQAVRPSPSSAWIIRGEDQLPQMRASRKELK
jgi:hypothetical protein